MSWLDGAVPTEPLPRGYQECLSSPHMRRAHESAFECSLPIYMQPANRCLDLLMALDDEDVPVSYFLYVVAIFAVIAVVVAGAYFYLFH